MKVLVCAETRRAWRVIGERYIRITLDEAERLLARGYKQIKEKTAKATDGKGQA